MAYLVEIYGGGFHTVRIAWLRDDAERIRQYWERRGKQVDVSRLQTEHVARRR